MLRKEKSRRRKQAYEDAEKLRKDYDRHDSQLLFRSEYLFSQL